MSLRSIFRALSVLFLVNCLTDVVMAAPPKAMSKPIPEATLGEPRSFAVFTASYNTSGTLVRGGVCGTVFFVSPTRAITAYHVLQSHSFHPLDGFQRVRVWLVHEGYRPIEMRPEYLSFNQDKDITLINLPEALKVESKYVFQTGNVTAINENVETEGFVANTAGPVLTRIGLDIMVVSVPKLERLHLQGQLVRQAQVNLKAADINLKSSPEYELSYKPIVGISGGPVLANGRVIAMNSFADPRTFQHTWALQINPTPTVLARP